MIQISLVQELVKITIDRMNSAGNISDQRTASRDAMESIAKLMFTHSQNVKERAKEYLKEVQDAFLAGHIDSNEKSLLERIILGDRDKNLKDIQDRLKKDLLSELGIPDSASQTERGIIENQLNERNMLLDQGLADQLITQQEYNDLKLAAEQDYYDQLAGIDLDYLDRKRGFLADTYAYFKKFQESSAEEVISGFSTQLSALEGVYQQNQNQSKEYFDNLKKLSIATATLKGAEAITSAIAAGFAVGGPLGFALAATRGGIASLTTGVQIASYSSN